MNTVLRIILFIVGLLIIGLILSIFLKLAAVILLVLLIGALFVWIAEKLNL
jgi:hypothetical protein